MKTAIRESHLSLRGITVTYADGHTALAPTSLEVQHGGFLVLLGASGAGKSTLLRSINGLVSPTDGEVSVADLPGGTVSKRNLLEHRRHCGMVFQQHHLIGRQSVLANVLMGKLATRGSLASLWPWSKADKLEAPAAAQSVLTLLHDICKKDRLTAIVSLHQVNLARMFADRIVGLRQGQVVFDGTAAQLTEEAQSALYAKSSPANMGSQFDSPSQSKEFLPC